MATFYKKSHSEKKEPSVLPVLSVKKASSYKSLINGSKSDNCSCCKFMNILL